MLISSVEKENNRCVSLFLYSHHFLSRAFVNLASASIVEQVRGADHDDERVVWITHSAIL